MIDEEKLDIIYNALSVGMAKEDAYALAGLTIEEMEELGNDDRQQLEFNKKIRGLEYDLLNKMSIVNNKQVANGDHRSIAWSLEHLFPRYSGKPTTDLPSIHIHTESSPSISYDNVEVNE